ncbi:MAG: YjjI family glycine radical enzyme [Oscillospiraceae bacterium]|nr:YjjI family glycine radical enzyme [Oscillospiraceae bacterium]
MSKAFDIISNEVLTYRQQLIALAQLGESTDDTLRYSDAYYEAKAKGALCDLNEGCMPFRPRYICPDYELLFEKGCKFLELDPPTDLLEAVNVLEIFYAHVPSITTYPVYLGDLDKLLEPFVLKEDRAFAKKVLRQFLLQIDKVLTDSFVHADIGPADSVTARLLLELTEEMQLAIPNLTLRYDPELTSDDFALACIKCMLKTAKPSFANHRMFVKEWGERYAIASCYNGLQIAGGGFTLPRMRLYECSLDAKSPEDFLENELKKYMDLQLEYMDKRVKFIVEQSSFFKSNFLVTEGFVKLENFTGMFGVVGLAECCNHLLGIEDKKQGFGMNEEATALGIRIMDRIESYVAAHEAPYCDSCGHRYRLHAQVGIDTDGMDDSPGTRIPIGVEPTMLEQLEVNEKFHPYFPTGTGDIFKFEETYLKTPEAILPIIKGSLANGLRYFSGYLENNDVVRVTGYLVKKSEIEKLRQKKQSLNNVTVFGMGAQDGGHALDRRVQHHEESAGQ